MTTLYIPFDVFPEFNSTGMELYDLRHSYSGDDGKPLTAYFSLPITDDLVKIHFQNADIVRVLDEVYLDSEEYWIKTVGLKTRHFAYRVENSRFLLSQSEFYRDMYREAIHYRFVTGGACLDVLTQAAPSFHLVPWFARHAPA